MCNERTQRSRLHNEVKSFLKKYISIFACIFTRFFFYFIVRIFINISIRIRIKYSFSDDFTPSLWCGKLSINRLIGGVLAKKPIFRGEGRGNLKQKPEEEMRTNFPLTHGTPILCCTVYLNNGQHMR